MRGRSIKAGRPYSRRSGGSPSASFSATDSAGTSAAARLCRTADRPIAKALRRRCRVLILDEPTAALESPEIIRLFGVLRRLKEQGTGIVYVSHRLDEIVALADRCTVLRDGRVAAVVRRGAFNSADLVAAMTGRATAQQTMAVATLGEVLLEDREPRSDAVVLRAGQVLGLAGLLGSGISQVLQRFSAWRRLPVPYVSKVAPGACIIRWPRSSPASASYCRRAGSAW